MPKSPKGKTGDAKQSAEFKAFDAAMRKIIQVPKAELDKRLAEERNRKKH